MSEKSFLDMIGDLSVRELNMKNYKEAETDGIKYIYNYIPGNQWEPSLLVMSIPFTQEDFVSYKSAITLKRKKNSASSDSGDFIKTVLKMGDSVFRQGTGHRPLDRIAILDTGAPGFAKQYFASTAKTMALKDLFELGFHEFTLVGQSVKIRGRFKSSVKEPPEEIMNKAAPLLATLARDVPGASAPATVLGVKRWNLGFAASFIIAVGLMVLGLGFGKLYPVRYNAVDEDALFKTFMFIAVPTWIIFLAVTIRFIRPAMLGCFWFAALCFISFGGITLGGGAIFRFLNAELDSAAPVKRHALVLEKSASGDFYKARIQSWREGRETEQIYVGHYWYHRLEEGKTTLAVTVKPGFFGFEWISELDIAEVK